VRRVLKVYDTTTLKTLKDKKDKTFKGERKNGEIRARAEIAGLSCKEM